MPTPSRPKSARKLRLDTALVECGLAPDRARARALILARAVTVGGEVVSKAGHSVARDADLAVKKPAHNFVSRGALKLEAALERFAIDPSGCACLDVGASSGGFTDLLLSRGARRVYAVDVGYGQLAWSLRRDPRVVVLERENIRHLDPAKIPEPLDLSVIDVSFVSLSRVLPAVAALMGPPAGKTIVALVKPQFEVARGEVGRGGVVRDPVARMSAVARVKEWALGCGFGVGGVVESPAPGPAGNIEYLLRLKTPAAS